MTITIPPCESYTNEITKATDTTFELLDDRLFVRVKYKYKGELSEDKLCDFHGVFKRSSIASVILIWNTTDKTYDIDFLCGGVNRSFYISKEREACESVRSKLEAWIFGT